MFEQRDMDTLGGGEKKGILMMRSDLRFHLRNYATDFNPFKALGCYIYRQV